LTEKSHPEPPMLGYTDKSTVKLDFDDVSFKFVKYWALRTLEWVRLRGFIVLKSSKQVSHLEKECARYGMGLSGIKE
jgi:hypothetical protein